MPHKPLRPCSHRQCAALVKVGDIYCPTHKPMHAQDYSKARAHPEFHALYNNDRWRRYRKMFLAGHPLCVECGRSASVVDHIEPHNGDWDRFWNPSNHRAMCASCHSSKTARETQYGRGEKTNRPQ